MPPLYVLCNATLGERVVQFMSTLPSGEGIARFGTFWYRFIRKRKVCERQIES